MLLFLIIILFLSACGKVAIPNAAAQEAAPSSLQMIATPTLVPESEVPQVIYPFYLPLVTKPEIEPQTIDHVTTEIDWVYADESRVSLSYTVSGLDWPDGAMMDATSVNVTSPDVSDIGYGGSGGSNRPADKGTITGVIDLLFVEGTLDARQHPEIGLRVDIPVVGPIAIVNLQAILGQGPGQVMETDPVEVGTFHFEFNVPVKKGIRLENIDQTVVANHVSMKLKTLVLTPSRAEASICFQMPSAMDWGLTASKVSLGDKEYSFAGGWQLSNSDGKDFSLNDPERCSMAGFDIFYDESVTSIILTVPKLMSSVPEAISKERVKMANKRLEGAGIQFDYVNGDHGGNIEILKQPEEATNLDIYPLIWEAMSEQYEGPWIFTVEVKE